MKLKIKSYVLGALSGIIFATTVTAIAANFEAVTATFPILINGSEFKPENPAVVIEGRTYLPLRAIGEALGIGVNWNAELSRVEIGENAATATPTEPAPVETPANDGKLTFGSTFEFDGFEITFNKPVEWAKVDNRYSELNGEEVFKIPVTIKNVSDKTGAMNMFFYNQFGLKGTELKSAYMHFDDGMDMFSQVRPDASLSAYMYFLYDGDATYFVRFNNFSKQVEVELPISKN